MSPAAGRLIWNEETIRAALTDFLQGRDVWPTWREFSDGGAKGLREAITRIHGAAWWAREMGLSEGERKRGGIRRWTDDTIREALVELIGEGSSWPTARQFDEAGLHGLREALRHYGGPERWSREMGVRWTPRAARTKHRRARGPQPRRSRSRAWPRWNEKTIADELRRFLGSRDDWPRFAEFVAAGRKGLYQAILRHGGSREWARRMGVRWVGRAGGSGRVLSEDDLRERLQAFVVDRTTWPAPAEFERAGEKGLLSAARRRGGVERWAVELGLSHRKGRRESSWDDARIAAAISPLIEQLGRWPTSNEFRRAGLGNALSAVYGHGGSAYWQERFGVRPKRERGDTVRT